MNKKDQFFKVLDDIELNFNVAQESFEAMRILKSHGFGPQPDKFRMLADRYGLLHAESKAMISEFSDVLSEREVQLMNSMMDRYKGMKERMNAIAESEENETSMEDLIKSMKEELGR